MSTQPSLFEPRKLARRENPETSKAAARSCESLREGHHRLILDILRVAGRDGLTAAEIAARSAAMDSVQVSRRLHELVADGLVRATGKTRPTPTGRAAQCYAVEGGA